MTFANKKKHDMMENESFFCNFATELKQSMCTSSY